MRGGGHHHGGGGINDAVVPLLLPASAEWLTDFAAERAALVGRYRAALLTNCVVDFVAAATLYAAHYFDEDKHSDGFAIEKSVVDVLAFVAMRSVLGGIVAVFTSRLSETFVGFVYWFEFLVLLLLITKAIAFNWSQTEEDKEEGTLLALIIFSLALGLTEMLLTGRIMDDHFVAQDAIVASNTARVSASEENGNAVSASAVTPRLEQALRHHQRRKKQQQVGHAGTAGADSVTVIESGKEQPNQLSKWAMAQILKPYFWPISPWGKVRCATTWICLAISKVTNLMSPIYIGRAVQKLTDGGAKIEDIYEDIIWFSLLALASKTFRELQGVVYLRVKQHAYAEIAEYTFTHLHSLSLEWHVKKKMGNVLRSMDRGVSAADTVVSYLFLYLVPSAVECIIIFIIFYSHYDVPALSATAFLSLSLYCLATVKITLWRSKFRDQTNKHDNDYHDKATDSLINFETVKYFTAEKFETDRFTAAIVKFQKYTVNTQLSLSFLNSTQNLIIQICSGVCLCIAAHHVLRSDHSFNIGDFVSVNVFISNMFAPLSFLGTIYNAVIQAFSDMTNLSELLAEEPDVKDAPNAKPLVVAPNRAPSIEFHNVFFHYPTQTSNTGLQGVQFSIEPGTETAIVGHTGSGKTTISRLLFRFYDPLAGQILVDNQDIARVTQESLRKAIGVVPQDTVLFNDTIKYNILYGRQSATQEEIERACRAAQILDFIFSLPKGFETPVGERGLKLSGGEKQRVAIARCLLKNPPIVILDEATSALDSQTEQSVQAALNDLTQSRTTLVIAHRLSTIRNADQIIVMDHGRIVEKGTHTNLLSNPDGPYFALWNAQLRNQQEGETTNSSRSITPSS